MALSSSIRLLRGAPQRQADDIYNPYIVDAATIRRNQNFSNGYRLTQLEQRVTRATNALNDLLDSVNKAETAIRNKAAVIVPAGPASEVGEGVRNTIRDGYERGLDLPAILNIIVQQGDRPALAALKSLVPYYEKDTDRALSLIAAREMQLYTRDERAILAEEAELHTNMTLLRNNFKSLFHFFEGQLLPTAVSGMFQRLTDLNPWYGLMPAMRTQLGVEWDDLSRSSRVQLLSGDFVQAPAQYTAPMAY